MSSSNDGFNPSSTGGRNEGFRDSRGGVESYGQGTGSDTYDPTNTGPGGYGDQKPERGTQDQGFRTASDFDDSPQGGLGQSQTQGSQRAFGGGDRGAEKPGFSGSESTYDNTATGGTFSGSGAGQRDDTGFAGGRSTGATDDVRDTDQWNTQQGGGRDDQFGGEPQRERQGGKPTFGDKMRGNMEKLAGSVSGKPELKERGQEHKTGDF